MFQIIWGLVILVMLISLYASFQYIARPKKNTLLGICVSEEHTKHPEVMEIIKTFKKINRILLLLFLITSAPIFFLPYTSVLIIYLIAWYGLYMLLNFHYMLVCSRRLLLIKSRNFWFSSDSTYEILTDDKLLAWYKKHRLLTGDTEQIFVDDDKYWLKGYYYNPSDKRGMVDKRFGVGSTLNMATKGSKAFMVGVAVFMSVTLGGMILLLSVMDFAVFHLNVVEDTVYIQAPFYGYQFKLNEIKEIRISDTMPREDYRTNGAESDTYKLGNFNMDGYGRTKVYVYTDHPPYIVIKLKDLTVFFNAKTEEKTKEYYEILTGKSKD